jgi:predicted acetyltransferase
MLYAFLDGKIIGRSSIRHELNESLTQVGGNIGYAVATPYRGKGVATEILKQSLLYCRDVLGLSKVLVTCNDDNVASYKTIEKNNGKLEDRYISEDGSRMTRRYWIKL